MLIFMCQCRQQKLGVGKPGYDVVYGYAYCAAYVLHLLLLFEVYQCDEMYCMLAGSLTVVCLMPLSMFLRLLPYLSFK